MTHSGNPAQPEGASLSNWIRSWILAPVLFKLNSLERAITMNNAEQAELLATVNAQLVANTATIAAQNVTIAKIAGETAGTLAAVDALQAAIDAAAASGNTPDPVVVAAMEALQLNASTLTAAIQGVSVNLENVDLQVPDAAPVDPAAPV